MFNIDLMVFKTESLMLSTLAICWWSSLADPRILAFFSCLILSSLSFRHAMIFFWSAKDAGILDRASYFCLIVSSTTFSLANSCVHSSLRVANSLWISAGDSLRRSNVFLTGASLRLEMKNFWVSHRMCRKDVGRGFQKLIKKQIT